MYQRLTHLQLTSILHRLVHFLFPRAITITISPAAAIDALYGPLMPAKPAVAAR